MFLFMEPRRSDGRVNVDPSEAIPLPPPPPHLDQNQEGKKCSTNNKDDAKEKSSLFSCCPAQSVSSSDSLPIINTSIQSKPTASKREIPKPKLRTNNESDKNSSKMNSNTNSKMNVNVKRSPSKNPRTAVTANSNSSSVVTAGSTPGIPGIPGPGSPRTLPPRQSSYLSRYEAARAKKIQKMEDKNKTNKTKISPMEKMNDSLKMEKRKMDFESISSSSKPNLDFEKMAVTSKTDSDLQVEKTESQKIQNTETILAEIVNVKKKKKIPVLIKPKHLQGEKNCVSSIPKRIQKFSSSKSEAVQKPPPQKSVEKIPTELEKQEEEEDVIKPEEILEEPEVEPEPETELEQLDVEKDASNSTPENFEPELEVEKIPSFTTTTTTIEKVSSSTNNLEQIPSGTEQLDEKMVEKIESGFVFIPKEPLDPPPPPPHLENEEAPPTSIQTAEKVETVEIVEDSNETPEKEEVEEIKVSTNNTFNSHHEHDHNMKIKEPNEDKKLPVNHSNNSSPLKPKWNQRQYDENKEKILKSRAKFGKRAKLKKPSKEEKEHGNSKSNQNKDENEEDNSDSDSQDLDDSTLVKSSPGNIHVDIQEPENAEEVQAQEKIIIEPSRPLIKTETRTIIPENPLTKQNQSQTNTLKNSTSNSSSSSDGQKIMPKAILRKSSIKKSQQQLENQNENEEKTKSQKQVEKSGKKLRVNNEVIIIKKSPFPPQGEKQEEYENVHHHEKEDKDSLENPQLERQKQQQQSFLYPAEDERDESISTSFDSSELKIQIQTQEETNKPHSNLDENDGHLFLPSELEQLDEEEPEPELETEPETESDESAEATIIKIPSIAKIQTKTPVPVLVPIPIPVEPLQKIKKRDKSKNHQDSPKPKKQKRNKNDLETPEDLLEKPHKRNKTKDEVKAKIGALQMRIRKKLARVAHGKPKAELSAPLSQKEWLPITKNDMKTREFLPPTLDKLEESEENSDGVQSENINVKRKKRDKGQKQMEKEQNIMRKNKVKSQSGQIQEVDSIPCKQFVSFSKLPLLYNAGKCFRGILRLSNISAQVICYRVSSCGEEKDRYKIDHKEGTLFPGHLSFVTFSTQSPLQEVDLKSDVFKVETILAASINPSSTATRRLWMNTPESRITVLYTRGLILYDPDDPFFQSCLNRWQSPGDNYKNDNDDDDFISHLNEEQQTDSRQRLNRKSKEEEINVSDVLDEIQTATREIQNLQKSYSWHDVWLGLLIISSALLILYVFHYHFEQSIYEI